MQSKKILVIGSPGSGKSYFSRELGKRIGIPVYHMDLLYWHENWVSTPKEEFEKILDEIMIKEEWILDGNYQRTLKKRLNMADTVYFLDIDSKTCLEAEKNRRNKKREDFPDFLVEGEDPEFEKFILDFPKINKPIILDLLNEFPKIQVNIINSRDEMNNILKSLER